MRQSRRTAVALVTAMAASLVPVVSAQNSRAASSGAVAKPDKSATVTRTADGQPDLSGIWSFATATPFERPEALKDKEFLTAAEAADYAKKIVASRNKDTRDDKNSTNDVEAAYNDFWWDQGDTMVGTRRTSLVINPRDGRIPALTPAGEQRLSASRSGWTGAPNGPEDRSLGERCLMGFNAGPPMAPSAYNNNVQIFQTPDHVALLNEMIHNTRIIPIGTRPAPPADMRQWAGNSRAHWDKDTLVVVTTGFRPEGTGQVALRGASGEMRLTERFSRDGADTLLYEFTVEDPGTWVKPWTVQIPMTRTESPLYEYACHEGNYAMINMLSGARTKEKEGRPATQTERR
jgi:hypothetical protein